MGIAHRLSTVRDADKIVVIHEGKVIQEGTHSELADDHTGIYATMLRAQDIIGDDEAARRREKNMSQRVVGDADNALRRLNSLMGKSSSNLRQPSGSRGTSESAR